MTLKKIRARLDRLEVSAKAKEAKVEEEEKEKEVPFDFPIDPAMVQAIHDEYEFLKYAGVPRRPYFYRSKTDPDTPEETQTLARIAALASKINCPPSYGFKEYWDDDNKINKWWGPPNEVTERERAQATARMEAYEHSPEGQARIRLDYLENGPALLGPAEYEEMERLIKLYPEPWAQPRWTNHVRFMLDQRGTPKDRKLRFEKHQRWSKEREERSRSGVRPKKGPVATHWQVKRYIDALRKNGCPTF